MGEKGFTTYKVKNVSIEEMNKILEHADKYSVIEYGESYQEYNARMTALINAGLKKTKASLSTHSFLTEGDVKVQFTTKYGTDELKPCTYVCRLDGEVDIDATGLQAYVILRKYYKEAKVKDFPELKAKMSIDQKGRYEYSASPIAGYNPKFDKTRHPVWIYDLNSAYATQMMGKIPDISTYRFYSEVKEGEIGFLLTDGLPLVPEGCQGDVVMKLIDSPYKRFAQIYYAKKENAKTKAEKAKAKTVLNYSVGYLQRTNPFIRSYIVNNCNQYIESLMDDNTCMWNTDAIYSTVPRPELITGSEIGQFKVEHYAEFAQKGNSYQKDWEQPHNKGVCRQWFGECYDLLKDKTPKREQNRYELINRSTFSEDKLCLSGFKIIKKEK